MFVEDHDSTTLRQGDIIANVPFPLSRIQYKPKLLGTFKQGFGQHVELVADAEQIGRSWWLTAHTSVAPSFCAVMSQDCDVALGQHPPPPSFVLCRLVAVSEGLKKSKAYDRLTANVDPYGDARPFYQLFYIGNHPRLGAEEYVADCGMAMTVIWQDYDALLRNKTLEMTDLSRAKFRVKVGAHFGRPTAEEVSAGLAQPWGAAPEQPRDPGVRQRIVRAYRILVGREDSIG